MLSLLKRRRMFSVISLSLIITFLSWIFPYQFPLLQPGKAKASTVANPQVAAGCYHSLALTPDGKIFAWGYNNYGQLGNGTTASSKTPVQVSSLTSTVTAIAAGHDYSLALTSGGKIFAWGYNSDGELGNGTTTNSTTPVQVSNITGVTAIAAGAYHSLALTSDGKLWAWGNNGNGQLGNGTTTNSSTPVQVTGITGTVTAIAAGAYHSLALTSDGKVWSWGWNYYGQLGNGTTTNSTRPVQVSSVTGITAIAAGYYHSLALASNGNVFAWGYNSDGELGNGATANSTTPVQVSNLAGATAVSGGCYHSMATTSDGKAWAWGGNGYGQLGNGTTTRSTTPVQVSNLTGVSAVSASQYHSLALTSNGNIFAWGYNQYGQLGNGTTTNSTTPVQVTVPIVTISSPANGGLTNNSTPLLSYTAIGIGSQVSSVVIKVDGTVVSKVSGQNLDALSDGRHTVTVTATDGAGNTNSATSIFRVETAPIANLAAGYYHSLALNSAGQVFAWGGNGYGQLGNGTTTGSKTPVQVSSLTSTIFAIAVGEYHSLALTSSGNVFAWGYNNYGQLGNGTTTNSTTPAQVSNLTGINSIAGGSYHSLALNSNGNVFAWGYNGNGELGNGTTTNSTTPVQTTGITGTVTAIAAGADHSLALTSDGKVWAWGWNYYGQLGNGTTTNSKTPIQVSGITGTVVAIAAGYYHSLALTSDGKLWAWGYNYDGEFGNGTTTNSTTPVQVSSLTGITTISAGCYHSLALTSDGKLWAWGGNLYGQLGNGTTTRSTTPVQVSSLTSAVTAIATGQLHSLALTSDGNVFAWGYNSDGELGNGTTTNSSTPVKITGLKLDVTPPTVWASPAGGLYKSSQQVTLSASEPASIYYTADGTTPTASSMLYIGIPINILATTNLKYMAIDQAGNQSQVYSQTYTIDTISPTISFITPSNEATITGDITVTASASDNLALSQADLTLQKYGTSDLKDLGVKSISGASATINWDLDTTKLTDGEYTLALTATDTAGNTSTTQENIKVANIPCGMGLDHWGTVDNMYGKVNIANGNFVVTQDDIKLPGRGLGTELTRTYNSQVKVNGLLGWGWRLDVPEIAQYSDGSVTIVDGDGASYNYSKNLDGTYSRPAGCYDTLTKNADSTFTWKFKDGDSDVFDIANKKLTEQDKNNNSVVYLYDSLNRLTSITDPTGRVTNLSYDPTTGKLTSVTDYASRTLSYSYDSNNNLIKVTDPLNHSMSFTYDPNHKLLSISDANSNTTSFTYNGDNISSEKDPLGNTTSYSYDTINSKFTATDPKGNITTYQYDSNWNVTTETDALNNTTSFTYDGNFNVLTKKDALGRVESYTYDSMGNTLTEKDAMLNTTSYTYDANNNALTKTDPLGVTTNYTYDTNGNLLSEGATTTSTATYTYDSYGNKTSAKDSKGTTTYSYDANGNLTGTTDALGNTDTATYDASGNKTAETDAKGVTTTYTYDTLGHMLSVSVPGSNSTTNTTTYTYDANGNRLQETDAAGKITTWTYNALNKVVSETDPDGKTKTITYNTNGNALTQTEPGDTGSKTTTYAYDSLNQVVTVTNPDSTTVSYTYDAVGNKKTMTDTNGSTTYTYDSNNNLTQEVGPTSTINYSYDPNNRLTAKTVNNKTESYNYDGQNNLTSIVDASNNYIANFTYDGNNNLTAANYANSAAINYTYDAANKLTSITNTGPTGPFASFNYTYFANDLINAIASTEGTTTYEYDGQNRLSKITDPTGKITAYTYDTVGNRTSMAAVVNGVTSTTTYTCDSLTNELTLVTRPDSSTINYTYDAAGNIVLKRVSTDSTGTAYEYNSNNQLVKVTKPNGDTIGFAYDGDNRRISKTVNGVTTKYIYAGHLLAQETAADGTVTATYTYDDKGAPVKVVKGSNTYYFQYNGQGDVVALTDATGTVAATYKYDDWGNLVSQTGTIDTPFGYRGQYGYVYDKETGLYFLTSRYYDPETGRFTTKDRFRGFENRPAGQNRYAYCENDPVNKVDPSGFDWSYLVTSRFYIGKNFSRWFIDGYGSWRTLAITLYDRTYDLYEVSITQRVFIGRHGREIGRILIWRTERYMGRWVQYMETFRALFGFIKAPAPLVLPIGPYRHA